MSKKIKIAVGDEVLYFIEKDKVSIMEWGSVVAVQTYKKYKTVYSVQTSDGKIINTWRKHLIKAADAANTLSVPKALYDSVQSELTEMERSLEALIEAEHRPVAKTGK